MVKLSSLSIFSFLFLIFSAYGQENSLSDALSPNVKSVWFEKDDWRLAYPVINITGGEQLTLHFDMIDSQDALCYTIIHCDRDWQKSDLFFSDYAEGFEENYINDFESSFNTTISYSHYSLSLPNDDIQFKLSGNYVVAVYLPGEAENPVLTRRFFVYEGSASTQVVFRKPVKQGCQETHQQSEIKILTGNMKINDPYREISLTILQNGRWDRMKSDLAPDFVGNGEIIYNYLSDKTLFPGGNEFRYFDIKTIRQKRQNVKDIQYVNGNYHAFLNPSDNREFKQYFYNEDFNGRYYIAMEESDEPDRDADYVYVYFTLPSTYELTDGDVYVMGAFTDWAYRPSNRMTYNPSGGRYELLLLLKQGWYNYEYAFVRKGSDVAEAGRFEGNHYETENDYLILTYYRERGQRYDRLLSAFICGSGN